MEQIKNSKREKLKQPYLDLALMRREQKPYQAFSDMLLNAFDWSLTNEGRFFWSQVFYECKTPDIPADSLAELEAWRKAKAEIGMEAPITPITDQPDYKVMYEKAIKDRDAYKVLFEEATKVIQPTAELQSTSRNWIAECAMAAFTGNMLSSVKDAWHLAEKWAAEGKKRGHI